MESHEVPLIVKEITRELTRRISEGEKISPLSFAPNVQLPSQPSEVDTFFSNFYAAYSYKCDLFFHLLHLFLIVY